MPLAVKNNAIIVKDGRLAENCGCCGGACCDGTTCSVTSEEQCRVAGKTFRGLGTTCSPNPCGCCGTGDVLSSGNVSVSVVRSLNVIARSSCACEVFSEPPASASQCRSDSAILSQSGGGDACSRTVVGIMSGTTHTGTNYSVSQDGTVGITPGCMLYALINSPLNPCGGAIRIYYAWPFVSNQSSYSGGYSVFLFLDGLGSSVWVQSTSSTTPEAPTHPSASSGRIYFYGGAMWTVSLAVNVA